MAYTIQDVAEKAGVSPATVSKVLNNKMYVAPATREKVLAVVKAMGYSPNASAANLAKRATRNILYADGFCKGLPFRNPHMFDIICGAEHELSRRGYHLTLLNLNSTEKKVEQILEDAMASRSADGIILNGSYVTPQIERQLLQRDFPQICIGKPEFDSILSWIDTNNTLSANMAVEHLLAGGCRRLAYMGGQQGDTIFMDRLAGFRLAAQKNDLQIPPDYIIYNEPDIDSIFRSAMHLLELPQRPDGIVCTNSLMTVGTMRAIAQKDLEMPRDISLIAFDDYPYTPLLSPKPTVIEIDLFSLGVHAGSQLLRKIKDPAMLIQTYTALPRLLQRGTTREG